MDYEKIKNIVNRFVHATLLNPRILIFIFSVAILNVAIIAIASNYTKKSEELLYNQTFKQLQSITDMKHHKLHRFFAYRLADIESLAKNSLIMELAGKLAAREKKYENAVLQRDRQEYEALIAEYEGLQSYLENYLSKHYYEDMLLIDADDQGHLLYSFNDPDSIWRSLVAERDGTCKLKAVWQQVKLTGETQMGDMHLSKWHAYKPIMIIATPVYDHGKMIAVLVLQLPNDIINDLMHFRSGMGKTGESYAVGLDHLLRSDSYLESVRTVKNSFATPGLYAINTRAAEKALNGEPGSEMIKDYRGISVFSVYKPFDLDGFRWAIITEIDEDEIKGQFVKIKEDIRRSALLLSVALTIIGYFIIKFIVDRTVVKPMQESYAHAKGFEDILENSLNEIYIFDKHSFRFSYINRGAIRNIGYTLEEMKTMTPMSIKPQISIMKFLEIVRPLLEGEQEQISFETVHMRKDGTTYDTDIRLQLMLVEGEEKFVAFINDITARNEAIRQKELYYEHSTHDYLTQLYNRRRFNELFDIEIERSKRYGNTLSMILFDIDHFKTINDTYGHETGDVVLKALSGLVRNLLRDTDIFARWGGEEFIILLPYADIGSARAKAEQIRECISKYPIDKQIGSITCSFGVSEVNAKINPNKAFKDADDALYRAKEGGRNMVVAAS